MNKTTASDYIKSLPTDRAGVIKWGLQYSPEKVFGISGNMVLKVHSMFPDDPEIEKISIDLMYWFIEIKNKFPDLVSHKDNGQEHVFYILDHYIFHLSNNIYYNYMTRDIWNNLLEGYNDV